MAFLSSRRALLLGLLPGFLAGLSPRGAAAQTLTQDQALALAFPDADRVERRTAYLEEAQLARASELAGPDVEIESGIVTYYLAVRNGAPAGVAYFDAHRVRTLPEVLMIVVGTDGRIRRVEVVSFHEPPEYRPPEGWLRQLLDRPLGEALSLRGDVAGITGATLTAGAVTGAARRVLALHEVIDPFGAGGSAGRSRVPGADGEILPRSLAERTFGTSGPGERRPGSNRVSALGERAGERRR